VCPSGRGHVGAVRGVILLKSLYKMRGLNNPCASEVVFFLS
jgi:hypothetical protein